MTHDEGYVLPPNHPAFVSESYDELLKKVDMAYYSGNWNALLQ